MITTPAPVALSGLAQDVRAALLAGGLTDAVAGRRRRSPRAGFTVIPMTAVGPERAVVRWHYTGPPPATDRTGLTPQLARCVRVLRAAGYRTEHVTDQDGGYLAVWRKGWH